MTKEIKWRCNICGCEFTSDSEENFNDESRTHFEDHIDDYIEKID